MTTDAELLRRFAGDRSEEAFAEIVNRHLKLVYAAAVRRLGGDVHSAADVVQTVFCDLANHARSAADHPVLASWLYTSTRYAVANLRRGEVRRRIRETEAYDVQTDQNEPSTDWSRLRPIIDSVVDELNPRDREAVLLRFFDSQSFPAIGQTLNVTDDAARMRVDRALERMRQLLVRRGVTSSAVALASALGAQPAITLPAGLAATVTAGALVGGGVGTAATFLSLTFMNAKVWTGISALAAVVALSVAIHSTGETRRAEDALAQSGQQLERTRAQLGASEQATAALQRDVTALRTQLAPRAAQQGPPVAPQSATARPAPEGPTPPPVNLRSTEVQRRLLEYARVRTKSDLAPLFTKLGISAQQQEEVLQNFFEPVHARYDASDAAKAAMAKGEWSKENDAKLDQMLTKQSKQSQEKIRGILGDSGFAEMERTMATVGERAVVDLVSGRTLTADTPVTAESADALVRLMFENRVLERRPTGDQTLAGTPLTADIISVARSMAANQGVPWLPLVSDSALTRAATTLPRPQVNALQQLQTEQSVLLKIAADELTTLRNAIKGPAQTPAAPTGP